ncbi:hypothetical protein BDP27DRAFT_307188 [Rhodocollybia butyracea]|uniref:Uncharacterized protein n=1 Tax=Rhodocollybia butyracea TaxID=206335 RepID=A0A9P5PEN4_9AGAR|nr:hypothetical protein BDP27DRAFT_307188 [Rhodocollybia butyracea]
MVDCGARWASRTGRFRWTPFRNNLFQVVCSCFDLRPPILSSTFTPSLVQPAKVLYLLYLMGVVIHTQFICDGNYAMQVATIQLMHCNAAWCVTAPLSSTSSAWMLADRGPSLHGSECTSKLQASPFVCWTFFVFFVFRNHDTSIHPYVQANAHNSSFIFPPSSSLLFFLFLHFSRFKGYRLRVTSLYY